MKTTPLDVALLGLATARLTRLIVDDEITEPARLALREKVQHVPPGSFTDQVDTAVNCYACSSVWAGGAVLTAEAAGGVGRFLVRVLALSQMALAIKSVTERIDR